MKTTMGMQFLGCILIAGVGCGRTPDSTEAQLGAVPSRTAGQVAAKGVLPQVEQGGAESQGASLGACQDAIVGDAQRCYPAADHLAKARAVCGAADLAAIGFNQILACDNGQAKLGRVQCCALSAPQSAPPAPGACVSETVGSAKSCASEQDLQGQAMLQCKRLGGSLQDGGLYGVPCAGGYGTFTFQCCAAPGPGPNNLPPGQCIGSGVGGHSECMTEAALNAAVAAACGAKNGVADNITYQNACGAGSYTTASFRCCGITPPAPAAHCMTASVGSVGSCDIANDLFAQSMMACAKQGAVMDHVVFAHSACATNQYEVARFTCCQPQ